MTVSRDWIIISPITAPIAWAAIHPPEIGAIDGMSASGAMPAVIRCAARAHRRHQAAAERGGGLRSVPLLPHRQYFHLLTIYVTLL